MDYLKEAARIADNLVWSVLQNDNWNLVKQTDDMQVYAQKSPNTSGKMYKCDIVYDSPMERVLTIVDPNKEYRTQWDEYLTELKVVERLSPTVTLVYHATKPMLKGIVSARDSLDAVTVDINDKYCFVAAGSIDHPQHPPRTNFVRIRQFASGYVIVPLPESPEKCRFSLILDADMKMNSVMNFVAEQIKPSLMIENLTNMRRGVETLVVTQ